MTTTNYLKTTLLLGAMTGLILLCGGLLGGRAGMGLALVLAAALNLGSYWFSDKIVLARYRAKPVSENEAPRLHAMLDRLCARAGLPKPKLYLLPERAPNAFATGRNPRHAAVAVTAGMLETMDQEEVEGILAHELAHIQNRDILISSVAARYAADASAAEIAGSPRGLARALEKLGQLSQRVPLSASPATSHMFIVTPLSAGGLGSLFSTHPPIEERVRRLLGR